MFSAAKIASPTSSGYNLTNSVRTRSSASAYLSRTPATSGTGASKTWTYSIWVKRGVLGVRQSLLDGYLSSAGDVIEFTSSDTLEIYRWGAGSAFDLITTQVFRDPSAWYHIVVAMDTTQATAANRLKLYINGSQVTSFSTATYPPVQNQNTYIGDNNLQDVGRRGDSQFYFDGYLTEVNFIDGQALTPSSFGSYNSTTGVWQPAKYTGTYGTNGFYLPFTDNSALTTSSNVGLGKDFSGNGNYWTTNNISLTAGTTYDSMTDVPTLTSATAANFAVLNPIGNGSGTLSNGNLRTVTSTTLPDVSDFAMQSGKWYWEVTLTVSSNPRIGMYDIGKALPTAVGLGGTNSWAIINGPSRLYYQGTIVAYGSFVGNSGSVVMIAYDATNGNLWFGENGSWFSSGNPATSANPSLTGVTGTAIVAATASGSGSNTFDYNFGQQPFTYTPPTGFVALNTYNLPTSTVLQGSAQMNAVLQLGSSVTTGATLFSQLPYTYGMVWGKDRTSANNNQLVDTVRGTSNVIQSNTTAAETTYSAPTSTDSCVAWGWNAGSAAVTNTNGTITSTVSVNATAGFSVVTYTGTGAAATVGHGLGVAPSWIVVKGRVNVSDWRVYHSAVTLPNVLNLDTTSAAASDSGAFGSTAPTSSVFTLGTGAGTNASADTYVAYCWTPIAGFSAFGSVSANGAADNAFVYTGFLPRFVLFKRTDSTSNWYIWDTARNTVNVFGNELYPNLSNAEASATDLDILSNGFKLRSSSFSGTWIYAAFASNPFKNSLAF
jgi:hypothetical protein